MAKPQTSSTEAEPRVTVVEEVESLIESWRRERPDVDMSSLHVFLPLRRALQNAEMRRARVLARHHVTPAMLDLLVAMRRTGPPYVRTPSDLARQLVLSAGGVSQRLERLEKSGLIERTVNTDDRRIIYVRLTDKGLGVLDDLIGDYMAHEESLLAGMSARQRTELSRMLVRLNESIGAAPELSP